MKKEIGIAIFFGVLLGLIVAIVMVSQVRKLGGQKAGTIQTKTSGSQPAKNNISALSVIEIKEPKEKDIVSKNSITIKGTTQKGSLIVMQSPARDVAFRTESEVFSTDFPLALGENVIAITAYPKDQKSRPQEKILTVYYLDEQ